jgi:hypothetical protein
MVLSQFESCVLGLRIPATRGMMPPMKITDPRIMKTSASPREQALIAALVTRYTQNPKADRAPLDVAYATAMGRVAADFPDDHEIALLYAEAVMDLSPWNYWCGHRFAQPDLYRVNSTITRPGRMRQQSRIRARCQRLIWFIGNGLAEPLACQPDRISSTLAGYRSAPPRG